LNQNTTGGDDPVNLQYKTHESEISYDYEVAEMAYGLQ